MQFEIWKNSGNKINGVIQFENQKNSSNKMKKEIEVIIELC